MWDEFRSGLSRFPDAVLTGFDAQGRPTGVRSSVRVDPDRRRVLVPRTAAVDLVDGPASLLCHSHDARLWRLRSFLATGTVTADGDDWAFHPTTYRPGTGMSGPIGDLRGFIAARGRAGRYLQRRGLARPAVPWDRFRRLR